MRFTAAFVLVMFVSVTGCQKNESNPEKVSDADRILLEGLKQKELEKQQILANPNSFIENGKWDKFDKGIINDYTQITACEFSNNSNFAITGISGTVTVFAKNGTEIGSIPFSAEGVLLAGETKRLKVASGELSGNGFKAKFQIKHINLIGD